MEDLDTRIQFATDVCRKAGAQALRFFEQKTTLSVLQKGTQDWVSEADVSVERSIRERIQANYPDDGIIGEEFDPKKGTSGFEWVIDPIDGTTNFINGIPAWTVVLAGVSQAQTQIGTIYDPSANELYAASRGGGAFLNGVRIAASKETGISQGTVAVGYSNRVEAMQVLPVIESLLRKGAMFHRNASGALSLAYVAAGRLLGYVEEHMNAWDCLAGQLLVHEAGGIVEDQNADQMIATGGRVVVGNAYVFDQLISIADAAWSS